jgi:hypothetical protein
LAVQDEMILSVLRKRTLLPPDTDTEKKINDIPFTINEPELCNLV